MLSILSSFTALIQFLSNQVKLMRTVTATKKESKKNSSGNDVEEPDEIIYSTRKWKK